MVVSFYFILFYFIIIIIKYLLYCYIRTTYLKQLCIPFQLNKDGEVMVTFVDYGNPESVRVHEIRTHLIHTDIPILCYKAVINNVMPVSIKGILDDYSRIC